MGVLGFHVICTTYGFWLPNDERGSGSEFIRKKSLLKFGKVTYTNSVRSVAAKRYDPEVRELARDALKYPHVILNGKQAQCIAIAIKNELEKHGGTIHSFSILPTHFHFVSAPTRYDIRRFAGRLRGEATKRLIAEELHPLREHADSRGKISSSWARLPWIRYLWTDADMLRAIKYVEDNPLKEGKRRQRWSFVTPYPSQRGASHAPLNIESE
ncbi:MAG TPA: hypothetical protein VGG19_03175 [Tepidisphaeraceae bacterium]